MRKSFYQFILKYRSKKKGDELGAFAEEIYNDHAFPKYSMDYHEISSYLELNDTALNSVRLFDQVWDAYEQEVLN
ncbi:YozE family protein [Bacillus sp. Marseille-P3661]|uniref:YozE family protein n=1 Tax=Bacillus sp. Marseille-P3661 TaxID=1936234 RepID=UPI000C835A3A|nr:YozE family protein [Bacillus sp. Marseille-P3661]